MFFSYRSCIILVIIVLHSATNGCILMSVNHIVTHPSLTLKCRHCPHTQLGGCVTSSSSSSPPSACRDPSIDFFSLYALTNLAPSGGGWGLGRECEKRGEAKMLPALRQTVRTRRATSSSSSSGHLITTTTQTPTTQTMRRFWLPVSRSHSAWRMMITDDGSGR
uniref:Putative secreted protein n=1 Tax=Anopheles darlingi TaxID=43151 RepID=A0A2M4DI19_ANODA